MYSIAFNTLSELSSPLRAYVFLAIVISLDSLLEPEFLTAFFYLFPVAFMTLSRVKSSVVLFCFIAALGWFVSNFMSGQTYSSLWVGSWNFIACLVTFVLVSQLIAVSIGRSRLYEYMANNDSLTGIFNRRGFMEKAEEEFIRSKRFKRPFSVAFLDLDNFKQVNDNFGHHIGDKLLVDLSKSLKSNIRQIDHVGRLGGDEFAILFVETDQQETKKAMIKCLGEVSEFIKSDYKPVSISAGVVTYTGEISNFADMLNAADKWMYQVKKSGKNNTVYKFDYELDLGSIASNG